MKAFRRVAALPMLAASFWLAGCSLFPSTRKLPVPKAPAIVQTVTPDQLVEQLNQHWDAVQAMTAKVTMQASLEKPKEGLVRDEPTIPGVILWRKPGMLRVLGQVPILGTRMFDMASNGKNFTMYIPSRKQAIEGPNTLNKLSPNQFENMRPKFFFDAMVVQGVGPDDRYSVTSDSETIEDPSKKHLLLKPEYVLSVLRAKPNSRQDTTMRQVVFDRATMLPYEQDIYDAEGKIETKVLYSGYRDFGSVNYPSTIVIERPLEAYQIVLTVETVNQNLNLKDDQFEVTLPPETQVKHLD